MKYKSLLNMWLQVLFVGCSVLFCIQSFTAYRVGFHDWVQVALPVTRGAYWYFSAYVLLFLLLPVINAGIETISIKNFRNLIFSILVLCSVTVPWFLDERNGCGMAMHKGYSTIWLIVMYLVGAYIKKTSASFPFHILLMVAMAILACMGFYSVNLLPTSFNRFFNGGYLSPVVLIMSVVIFMICLKLKSCGRTTGCVLKWSASVAFGVYLIHTHPYIFWNIWIENRIEVSSSIMLIGWMTIGTLCVFLICGCLETLRRHLFAILRVDKVSQWFCNRLERKINQW